MRAADEAKAKEERDLRVADINERNRIDAFVRDKQEEERKLADKKRYDLKQLTENDRKLKKDQAGGPGPREDPMADDLLTKIFDQKDHQSYKLRARNDKLTAHIQGKFDF